MAGWRIHITGASGSGTTTLGRVLAGELAVPHHDTDDYYWLPTVPPYATARPAGERLRLMQAMFAPRPAWVLSGSLGGWAGPLVPCFDLVVFLRTATETRLDRLRAREARRYGAAAIAPGGDRHREVEAFLDWASRYEHGDREGRTLQGHEAWLAALPGAAARRRPAHSRAGRRGHGRPAPGSGDSPGPWCY